MKYRNIKLGGIVEPGSSCVEEQLKKSPDYVPLEDNAAEESANADKPIDKMTVAELKALAAERGIELPADAKKADIIELLR